MRFRRRQPVGLHYPWTAVAIGYTLLVVGVDGIVGHGYTALGTLAVVPVLLSLEWTWIVVVLSSIPLVAFAAVAPFDPAPGGVAEVLRAGGVVIGVGVAIGLAVSRNRKTVTLERSQAVAETAQSAIVPPVPPTLGPYAFSVSYRSAADEALVGGDFYNVVGTPYGVRLIVGDVQGKGLDAVRVSAHLIGCFREWAPRMQLRDLVSVLDDTVTRSGEPHEFVTAVVANLDDELHLDVANCGHPCPALLTVEHRCTELVPGRRTTPLGLFADPVIERQQLSPSDRVFFYTDGLLEARDRHHRVKELDDVLHFLASAPFDASLTEVLQQVGVLPSGLRDDIAMLLLECSEPSADHPAAVAPAEKVTHPWWKSPPARSPKPPDVDSSARSANRDRPVEP